MNAFDLQQINLPTGVTLDVAVAGDPANPAIILLHGFPESHRTWRHQIPELAKTHFVLAPDQRGFARSSKPAEVSDYTPDKMVGDLVALADHFAIGTFTLVGHDWGGAIAWMAALTRPDRVERLIIINAPHPFVFQKTMFDDLGQREASQYIRAFRNPEFEKYIDGIGLSAFFDGSFLRHTDFANVADEKPIYLDQWDQPGAMTAMLNWYRASAIVVPEMHETPERPAFLDAPFPPVKQPTLVIWGLKDAALLPSQLEGLDTLVPDMTLVKVDAGHFVPWEAPEAVTRAILGWLS
ncbi:alpha/beta hydrolase [Sphingomonas sp. So64.6b]|uniref:alpha/beta fold hydrolase n=1 Tax=Sphingomonas sp. So64.6b TaxID=2997354 RepID=UPI0015FFD6F2|nr:alpha/beta hydrolase [Sphingomonas sp. So64.6b]QNA86253.1 alpha/beta hydrolase [Sphingomonas sp. So64.6b]